MRLTRPFALTTALLLASVPAWALYKVVGPNGEITYTDRPPVDAKKAQPVKVAGDSSPSTDGLPYQLQQLVSRYPVVLYSSARCSPCDSGRQLLTRRGIPFTEKTVTSNEDLKAYSALSGTDQLPLLKIGNQQLRGYAEQEWSEYLTAAGYPEQSSLPSTYKAPAATPLTTPPAKDTSRAAPSAAPNPSTSAPPAGNAPPGFRF